MDLDKIDMRDIFKVGIFLMVLSLIINSILFFIGDLFDVFSPNVKLINMDSPFGIFSVIILTIIFIIIGLFGFYVLLKYLKLQINQIRIISVIIVLLSLGLPFSIPQAPIMMIIFLLLMHIMTGLIVIIGLTTNFFWVKL